MKRLITCAVLILLLSTVLWADTIDSYSKKKIREMSISEQEMPTKRASTSRDTVIWNVQVPPTGLLFSYYDYMPGSYCNTPLQIQGDYTHPAMGEMPGGSMYVGYHAQPLNSERRIFISYISYSAEYDSYGVGAASTISAQNIREGYPSVDIDPATQDPIIAWHIDNDSDGDYEMELAYDSWHLLGSPGYFSSVIEWLDNEDYGGVPNGSPFADDQFIWPNIYIINAPDYDTTGKRRLLVFGNNYTSHCEPSAEQPDGIPSENVMLTITDFTWNDGIGAYEFDAPIYVTFPVLDDYNNELGSAEGIWGRYQKGFAATEDGKVAMMGFLNADTLVVDNAPVLLSALTVFYNENYGEGTWDMYQIDPKTPVTNPTKLDGSPYFDVDVEFQFNCWSGWATHVMVTFDKLGRLQMPAHMIQTDGPNADDTWSLWYLLNFPKMYIFDPATQQFEFKNIYPQSTDGNNTFPYLSWDEDHDGVVDDFWDEPDSVYPGDEGYGNPKLNGTDFPIWWHDTEDAFHENWYKVITCENQKYMAVMWGDGYMSYNAQQGLTYYAGWEEVPELAMCFSADHGDHWSDPIWLNSIETPELAGMIPVYWYPGNEIINLFDSFDDGWARIPLFFMDDNSFGSFIQTNGMDLGGQLNFMAIDVNFHDLTGWEPTPVSNNNQTIPDIGQLTLNNYPNPFNPTTKISFNLPLDSDVELAVYNVKGQLVKTIASDYLAAGTHTFTWNGKNNAGKQAASGVYFSRLKAGESVKTNKMLMLK
ncbi:MAG: T9SS type A sorting domain-containing protein [Candidatus Cloacimonetes bacterium]|nr:T9SS type A sorting domain-containing protein [Candidatus Cloacimonadota bacterium]